MATSACLTTEGPRPASPVISHICENACRRSRRYRSRLVREDVASLERVEELGALELLSIRLGDLVGSPLSINALREDLQVAHRAKGLKHPSGGLSLDARGRPCTLQRKVLVVTDGHRTYACVLLDREQGDNIERLMLSATRNP